MPAIRTKQKRSVLDPGFLPAVQLPVQLLFSDFLAQTAQSGSWAAPLRHAVPLACHTGSPAWMSPKMRRNRFAIERPGTQLKHHKRKAARDCLDGCKLYLFGASAAWL